MDFIDIKFRGKKLKVPRYLKLLPSPSGHIINKKAPFLYAIMYGKSLAKFPKPLIKNVTKYLD